MINTTSPTIAAMLNDIPQGYGNMPYSGFYGYNVGQSVNPALDMMNNMNIQQPSFNTPYPSPKEMLAQAGQMSVYQPTTFAPQPQNIVGGYNPGYQAAFGGYSNPYMGYGYSGFNPCMYGNYDLMMPPEEYRDPHTMSIYETAKINGISYYEQLVMDCEIDKKLTAIVCRFLGASDEEVEAACKNLDIYNRDDINKGYQREPVGNLRVEFVDSDGNVYSSDPNPKEGIERSRQMLIYENNVKEIEFYQRQKMIEEESLRIAKTNLYNRSVLRKYDNTSLNEFINGDGLYELAVEQRREINERMMADMRNTRYNSHRFANLLRSSADNDPQNKFGRLPNGQYVSPSHDPSIASSFSLDKNGSTINISRPDNIGIDNGGNYTITPPSYLSNALDIARERFIRSLESNEE